MTSPGCLGFVDLCMLVYSLDVLHVGIFFGYFVHW